MIRVGTAGWSYPDWDGVVVPRRKPRGFHALSLLARTFDCVEVNSSFYGLPDPRHVAHWVDLVDDRPQFRFLAKLHRSFTHEPWVADEAAARARAFRAALEPLRSSRRLGAWLAQFPASFENDGPARARLAHLAELFEGDPLALEVRHRSWFEPEALARFASQRWSVAFIDLPTAPQHPPDWHSPTGPIGYLRLHGRNVGAWFNRAASRDERYDYLYSPPQVEALVEKAQRLAEACDETYVVANNHYGGQAVVNAIEILAALRGTRLPAPAELVSAFPRLAPLVRAEGQRRLF